MANIDNLELNYFKETKTLSFGQRVSYVIEKQGISKAWVAEKLGISKQGLNYLLKHSTTPRFVDELAELLKLNPDWLETGDGNSSALNHIKSKNSFLIPLFSNNDIHNNGVKEVATIEFSGYEGGIFTAFKITDNSNFPPYINGSILIFDAIKIPENNNHVLLNIGNEIFVRQYLRDGDNICFKSISNEHKTFINPTAKILGVLIEARYKVL